MRCIIVLIATILFTPPLTAQQVVKGVVFEDRNNNGIRDRKEPGIAGVGVSNGVEISETDAAGRYSLPVGNDNIIFVIKPSDYKFRLNERNQPVFYYIHKPKGSPQLKYKGVDPTGPLPASVDFAMLPLSEAENFTCLLFGDPQPYSLQEVDFFERGIVAEVAGIKDVVFGISLGDLVGDNLSLHEPYMDAIKKIGIPWWNVIGNHDLNFDVTSDSLSDETYERNFGPANYSFNHGKVHFIVLDNVLYPDPRDGKSYWAGFREDQFRFLENDLARVSKDKLVVLAFHIPLQIYDESFNILHRDRFFKLLQDFPHMLSLSAHTHLQRNDFYTKEDGWMGVKPHHEYNVGTTSGDWYSGTLDNRGIPISTMRDGTRKGYAFIKFNGNTYTIDYKAAGLPSNYQMEVYVPKVVSTKRSRYAAYINFFMGRKGDKVQYKINDGEWTNMKHVNNMDPSYITEVFKWDLSDSLMAGRRPSNPENSTHLWMATIPTGLQTGGNTIFFRATDMFGREFHTSRNFLVQSPQILSK